MTDDEEFFLTHTERRFRLRQAEPYEAAKIGVADGWVVACKGGAIVTFANSKLPRDDDASLSAFVSWLGHLGNRTAPRRIEKTPSHRMVQA
jgi:hypothetical protein